MKLLVQSGSVMASYRQDKRSQFVEPHVDAVEPGGERRLKITEIFYSLQGEADTVGFPTVFVRLGQAPGVAYFDRLWDLSFGQLIETLPPACDDAALRRHYELVASAKTGNVRAADIQSRRVISRSSSLGSSSAVPAMSGSSAMPHFGHVPGPLCRTSGCMGQV